MSMPRVGQTSIRDEDMPNLDPTKPWFFTLECQVNNDPAWREVKEEFFSYGTAKSKHEFFLKQTQKIRNVSEIQHVEPIMLHLHNLLVHIGHISHMVHSVYYRQIDAETDSELLIMYHETFEGEEERHALKGFEAYQHAQIMRLRESLKAFASASGGDEAHRLDLMQNANETLTQLSQRLFAMYDSAWRK